MQVVADATEAQMVSLFLASELHSVRWRDSLLSVLAAAGASTDLIESPDTSSAEENRVRAAVLARYRGYREDRELFEGYPAEVRWFRAELDAEDIVRLKYIDYSYWNELSRGTRRPADAAATIRDGTEIFDVPNDQYFDGLRIIRDGGTFPPLILVSSSEECDLVILEGHGRATVYALAGGEINGPVKAMVGLHDAFRAWL